MRTRQGWGHSHTIYVNGHRDVPRPQERSRSRKRRQTLIQSILYGIHCGGPVGETVCDSRRYVRISFGNPIFPDRLVD